MMEKVKERSIQRPHFQYVPAYCFGRGWRATNLMESASLPGPGAYEPNKNPVKRKFPRWIFGKDCRFTYERKLSSKLSREEEKNSKLNNGEIKEYVPDALYRYKNESKKPKAPQYSFGKASRFNDGKKKRKKNSDKLNNGSNPLNRRPKTANINRNKNKKLQGGFQEEENFAGGDNCAAPDLKNDEKKSGMYPNVAKGKNNYKKKKGKGNDDDDYQDDVPGVGRYNLRGSTVVPVRRFGTEKKGVPYPNTASPGPVYNLREKNEIGKDAVKYSFPKDPRNKDQRPFTPGPGNYETRKNLGDKGSLKYSFGKENRLIYKCNGFPGPDRYNVQGKVGEDAKKISLSPCGRQEPKPNGFPGPDRYKPDYTVLKTSYPKYRIGTGKRRELYNTEPSFPSPDQYHINNNYNSKKPKSPTWRIGTGKRPPLYQIGGVPGVGMYTIRTNDTEGPKYSLRPKTNVINNKTIVPGAGQYNVSASAEITFHKNPSWKMGTSTRDDFLNHVKRENLPGAGTYSPNVVGKNCNNIKFTKDKKLKVVINANPGPGQYSIPCSMVDVNGYTREQGKFDPDFKFI